MKSSAYFVVILLLISSIAAIGIGKNTSITQTNLQKEITVSKTFLEPKTQVKDSYIEIRVEGTNGYLRHASEPIIPLSRTTLNSICQPCPIITFPRLEFNEIFVFLHVGQKNI